VNNDDNEVLMLMLIWRADIVAGRFAWWGCLNRYKLTENALGHPSLLC
jgi:hypothetical protein